MTEYDGFDFYTMNMTSQQWLTEADTDRQGVKFKKVNFFHKIENLATLMTGQSGGILFA